MNVEVIFLNARKVVIELKSYGIWYSEHPYQLFLNNKLILTSNRVVQTVNGLLPDTSYSLHVKTEDGQSFDVEFQTETEFVTLNVKRFGAKGDGVQDDTLFIQAAIQACPKGGRVWIPKGVYRVTTLFLKSDLTVDIDSEAVLSAQTERKKIPILPGMVLSSDGESEYNLGTWEGNPLNMFASLITGINVSNVVITGSGTLDGNGAFDNWWQEEGRTKIEGAWRPRMIFLNHCSHITIHGLTIQNSPAWNIHPYFSDDTICIDLKIINPKNSPNTDGLNPESVDGLLAVGIYFSLGDDCVAVKSGKYYMGHKYKRASQNLEFRQCYMRHGHGALTLGSEMAAGVKKLVCRDCIFEDTDRGFRVKTRRGRGNDAVIDDILLENIIMQGVLTPFVVNSYYWCCDPDGHSEYVHSKESLPIDEMTPFIKRITFRKIEAKDCHVAASFIYGLPEAKIEKVEMEDIYISFAQNPKRDYPDLLADVEPCTGMGLFINNVEELTIKNVVINGQEGEPLLLKNINTITSE